MSSSQKKGWPSFSFPPRGIGETNGRTFSLFSRNPAKRIDGEEEGNGISAADAPQRQLLLGESSSVGAHGRRDEVKGWKAFSGEGFLEDISSQRGEKEVLAQRIEELEKELYDYQYHMGLLLIEKKLQISEFEEFRQELTEAKETLMQEHAAFSHTLSEKQKQEHSILMALEDERQHSANLEKNIFKMQAQEKYLSQHRGTFQSLECRPQEYEELKLKKSQIFHDESMIGISKEYDYLCDEKKEELEETQNSFEIMNNSSKFREADIISRTKVLTSNEKDAESKQEKLENKKDPLATEVKLAAGESELERGRESLYEELEFKLNKLRKQNAIEGEYGRKIIDDLLAQRKEVESDKVKVQKNKETLNALYSSLQNLQQELIKKRDLLLSLAENCKTCKTGSILFNELDIASLENLGSLELAGDSLLLNISDEHLEMRMKGQNDDASHEHKGHKSVKAGGFMPRLRQCSELFSYEGITEHLTGGGNERNATDGETDQCLPVPVVSHEYLDGERVELDNGASCIDIIETFVETIHPEQYSEIVINSREVECCPNVSSINEQSEGSDQSSKSNVDKPRPLKKTGSYKVVVKDAELIEKDASKEMEQYLNWGSGDLKNAFGKGNLNFCDTDQMEVSAEQKEISSQASGAANSEMYSDGIKTPSENERHHKRQKTSDIGIISPGQKHYNFRPSTILKVSRRQLQKSKHAVQEENNDGTGQLQISEHTVQEGDSDGTDTDYVPTNVNSQSRGMYMTRKCI